MYKRYYISETHRYNSKKVYIFKYFHKPSVLIYNTSHGPATACQQSTL